MVKFISYYLIYMVAIIKNILRLLPFIISISGLFFSLITGHQLGIYFTLAELIFASGLNMLLKYLFIFIDPYNPQWLRPSPPTDGCGFFPSCTGNRVNLGGMPSGHAQSIMFSAIFWILYIWRKGNSSYTFSLISTLIILLISAVVIFSTVNEGCHNNLQVTIGGGFGVVSATLIYFLLENDQPHIFDFS